MDFKRSLHMVLFRSVGIFGYLWGPTGMLPGDPVGDLFSLKHDEYHDFGADTT